MTSGLPELKAGCGTGAIAPSTFSPPCAWNSGPYCVWVTTNWSGSKPCWAIASASRTAWIVAPVKETNRMPLSFISCTNGA